MAFEPSDDAVERGAPGPGRSAAAPRVRRLLAAAASLALLGLAAAVLWWQDWRFSLPTPRPAGLVQAAVGTPLPQLASLRGRHAGRPLLLHFFNPKCPCSRFNLDHVRGLQREWSGRVDFVAVVQGADAAAVDRALARSGLVMPAVADPDGRLAEACGVYASPQAVVLDPAGRLYFRGNYNLNRYCTDPATEFARMALDSLAAGARPPRFPAAGVSYGCELPSWRRRHV